MSRAAGVQAALEKYQLIDRQPVDAPTCLRGKQVGQFGTVFAEPADGQMRRESPGFRGDADPAQFILAGALQSAQRLLRHQAEPDHPRTSPVGKGAESQDIDLE